MSGPPKLLVVIPCFNEASSIEAVLRDLRSHQPQASLLVIDDGSSDDTSLVAAQSARVLRLPVNLGIGGAVQTGLRYAMTKDFDCCVQVDGDGQHPASEIAKLLSQWQKTGANLTIGSRFIGESKFRSTASRRIGISIIRYVTKLVSGLWVTDPTSGLRLFDRRALKLFSQDYPYDYPEPVSILLARLDGLSVDEIGVNMKERESGKSSIAPVTYMFRVCVYLLFIRLRRCFKS